MTETQQRPREATTNSTLDELIARAEERVARTGRGLTEAERRRFLGDQ